MARTNDSLGREFKNWLKEIMLRFTDVELRGMDADSDSPCPSIEIISSQGTLAAFVEPAVTSYRQGMSGKHNPVAQSLQFFSFQEELVCF